MKTTTKSVLFENKITLERLICDNIDVKRYFDGQTWISVRKPDSERKFLIREDALRRIEN